MKVAIASSSCYVQMLNKLCMVEVTNYIEVYSVGIGVRKPSSARMLYFSIITLLQATVSATWCMILMHSVRQVHIAVLHSMLWDYYQLKATMCMSGTLFGNNVRGKSAAVAHAVAWHQRTEDRLRCTTTGGGNWALRTPSPSASRVEKCYIISCIWKHRTPM